MQTKPANNPMAEKAAIYAMGSAYRLGQAAFHDDHAGLYCFRGAMQAAEDAGYPRGSNLYPMFCAGYLDAVTDHFPMNAVPVDSDGFVIADK